MGENEVHNCLFKLRDNPQRHKDKVCVGCGAGFGGDRPLAALKLLERVKGLDYLVLECLAERTLADRFRIMASGGKGYDPRIEDWMSLLLPLVVERKICIITNMGAMDPLGAQKQVLDLASNLGLEITTAVAYESHPGNSRSLDGTTDMEGGISTYLGAASIVHCLENYKPQVVITSRVADAALFLAPMVYELGWNWNDFRELAQGTLAGHLLECGCQLTGGYFMHPGDPHRDFSFEHLRDVSLPFAEISYKGELHVAKADGSAGLLSYSTCAEQLLYEVGDPGCYITPDLTVDFRNVKFHEISKDRVLCEGATPSDVHFPEKLLQLVPADFGWKGWGEISYGGHECLRRAQAAEFLVKSWIEEAFPGIEDRIVSYIIGHDSLKAIGQNKCTSGKQVLDVRLRMDGLFELEEHAIHFVGEFVALYTNGPAGGGGVSTGVKKEIVLQKRLVDRENIFWKSNAQKASISHLTKHAIKDSKDQTQTVQENKRPRTFAKDDHLDGTSTVIQSPPAAAPANMKIPLYQVAHSRAGDKGNDLNFSIIPHFPDDIGRLRKVITVDWVKNVVSPLLDASSFLDDQAVRRRNNLLEHVNVEIYYVPGVSSLNIMVRNILDGGVNCSRRIDRHGKTVSDLILCQEVILPL